MNTEEFERLGQLLADKGVVHEAFELLADLRQNEQELQAEIANMRPVVEAARKIEHNLTRLQSFDEMSDEEFFEAISGISNLGQLVRAVRKMGNSNG